jgi:hypothetical protein
VGAAVTSQTSVGTIVNLIGRGQVTVDIHDGGPNIVARVAETLSHAQLQSAVSEQRDAIVLFSRGERSQAVVLALVAPTQPTALAPAAEEPRPTQALVDGKRVEIRAEDEIVLKCGRASITLRRNGRVVIRGAYLESDSAGVNRIKGAAVKIN